MKKILFVLLFLSGVAYSQTYDSLGTVITSKMTTGRADSGTVNDFPTHISTYGMGGFQEVANTTSRNNIAPRRRKLGMIVYTRADSSFWQLRNDTSNANWTRLYLSLSALDSTNFAKLTTINNFTAANNFQSYATFGVNGSATGSQWWYNETNGNVGILSNQVAPSGAWAWTMPNRSGTMAVKEQIADTSSVLRTDLARKSQLNDSTTILRTDLLRKSDSTIYVTQKKLNDTANVKVDSIWRTSGKDSLQFRIGGRYHAIKDSVGGAGSVDSVRASHISDSTKRFNVTYATGILPTSKGGTGIDNSLYNSGEFLTYDEGLDRFVSSTYSQSDFLQPDDSTAFRTASDYRYNRKLVVRESDGSPRATQVDSLSFNKNNLTVTDSANGKIAINTIQDIGAGASPTFQDITVDVDIISGNYSNGLAYWNTGGAMSSIGNEVGGKILKTNGTATNPIYDSKIFLYPSDSAFSVTSSIKNKDVSNWLQINDTSAYNFGFTTGTGKPQFRIKDEAGLTTLYIDSAKNISGSEAANGDLTLQGTTNATRTTSYIKLQPNGGYVSIGATDPTQLLTISGVSTADVQVRLIESGTNRSTLFDFLPTGTVTATNPEWAMGTVYNDAANGFHFLTWDGATARDRFSIDTASNMTFTGKVKTFNNIATEGYGVPSIIDTIYRTLQTASIAAFNVANSAVAGLYEVNYYIECTATGTGNTTLTVDWDNATKSVTSTACSHSATTNFQQGTISIYHAATSSTSIRISTTTATTGTYAIRCWVKRIN